VGSIGDILDLATPRLDRPQPPDPSVIVEQAPRVPILLPPSNQNVEAFKQVAQQMKDIRISSRPKSRRAAASSGFRSYGSGARGTFSFQWYRTAGKVSGLGGSELFRLKPPEYTCYQCGMDDPTSCLTLAPRAPDTRPTPVSAKTIFDGTKLPLVVRPPQNHIRWVVSQFEIRCAWHRDSVVRF
jgi:hypothetical protein